MITYPSTARLINAVRHALNESIAPALQDSGARNTLGMIDSLLKNAAQRCENELEWMHQEIAEIEAMADKIVHASMDSNGGIRGALETLRSYRSECARKRIAASVEMQYRYAGEALSRCLEANLSAATNLQAEVVTLLEQRQTREATICGDFVLVGRE